MRNKLVSAIVTLGLALGLGLGSTGCIVHTRPRACGLGYHWNGSWCARNYQSRRYQYRPARTVIIHGNRR